MFEVSVDTTCENILMVLVHIATSPTNIKVAYKHVMIRVSVIVQDKMNWKFLLKRF